MGKERREKSILVGVLCAVILFMAIGFASIGSNLKIEGEASIGQTWDVQITSIERKSGVGTTGAVDAEQTPVVNAGTTAIFNVSLTQPGDYAVYTVTVENKGSIAAKLDSIVETIQSVDDGGSAAIIYTLTPAADTLQGSTLASGATTTFDVKVEYDSNAVGDAKPTQGAKRTYTLALNYGQDTSNAGA